MAKKTPKPKRREQIVADVRRFHAEITQYFADVASWNDNSRARKEGAEPIDPDPDGEVGRILAGLTAFLAEEDARPLPPILSAASRFNGLQFRRPPGVH